jgi:shikimate kinase
LAIKNQKSKIKNIFLIGYRCTGKTTVARILARRLDWQWLDTDEALEERYGRSIRAIFAEEGEENFREKESALLEEFVRLQEQVIATGGGIVLNARNRERMRQVGKVVWLTGDAKTLWQRLERDASTPERRPPLTIGGLAEVEDLLRGREPLYRECADMIVETVGRSPEEIAGTILVDLQLSVVR